MEGDRREAIETVENADVISLSFPKLGKALVIDTRHNEVEGPLVRLLPTVGSPLARLQSLRKMRPGFPRTRRLSVILWVRYVDSLVSLGIWDRVVQRFTDSGHQDAAAACDDIPTELRWLEKKQLAEVVSGESYQTLWSSKQENSTT